MPPKYGEGERKIEKTTYGGGGEPRRESAMTSPATLAPPLDNEDLLSLILIRLPPLPSSFSSASLVCKRWHRLVRGPDFLHRLRAFHRTPPVLGFFHNSPDSPRFVAIQGMSGIRIAAAVRDLRRDGAGGMWWFVDCRHGRALLRSRDWVDLLVWDPITDHRSLIIVPDQVRAGASDCNAAVLCPGATGCGCSPFSVVVVSTRGHCAFACVYSSLTRAWGELFSIPTPSLECELTEEPGTLVGDAMHWLLGESSILEFRLDDQRLALVERPLETFSVYKRNIRVLRSEDGVLGLAAVKNFSLHLWAREADHCGTAKWVLRRAIELCTLLELPLMQPRVGSIPVWISGLGEDGNVVFLRTTVGMYVLWTKTMQFKMVTNNVLMKTVYPYAKFYFLEGSFNGLLKPSIFYQHEPVG
ncbi:hypothetical protein SEVIR_9G294500v4 [Setaria viridis]|uniref:Uncharacterized protein n=1 Tax=Setaria viridis TaxID=4556 RepID=A0A4U6T3B4_SETVI|nr:hypothetical protein SEVIR_9G294500v2 [Setaria viridis]